MKAPQIGRMRDPVKLLAWSDRPVDRDDTVSQYELVAAFWAKIEPVGGGLFYGNTQIDTGVTHRMFCRYRTDMTAEHVIETNDGERYRIRRITNLEGANRFSVVDLEQWVGGSS